jgi:signal peptidase I
MNPVTPVTDAIKRFLRDYAEALVFVILLAVFLRVFVFASFKIDTLGMAPSLLPGDFILALRMPYSLKNPRALRGDVAILQCDPEVEAWLCVRRVVGLPGDRVEVKDGALLINGEPVIDPSTAPVLAKGQGLQPLVQIVPPDQVFVALDDLGQAQSPSFVRHFQWGLVSRRRLVAKAWRIWYSTTPGRTGLLIR